MDIAVIPKKVIVCDLDGTLAESKATIESSMVDSIISVLQTQYFAVISGGDWTQFEHQFLGAFMTHENVNDIRFDHLLIFPTSGAECRMYDVDTQTWKQVYDMLLSQSEKEKIMHAFDVVISELSEKLQMNTGGEYGVLVEDRGEQITFSGCGQNAPLSVKSVWDPDQAKRNQIIDMLMQYIPEFDITMGGMTSIDVTQKGINKAYAIQKIKDILSVETRDIVFIGDALYPGGNDSIARTSGVECIQVSGPKETEEVLGRYTFRT
jgi:HAD superfamily hydrolase (TIGR01484 family)